MLKAHYLHEGMMIFFLFSSDAPPPLFRPLGTGRPTSSCSSCSRRVGRRRFTLLAFLCGLLVFIPKGKLKLLAFVWEGEAGWVETRNIVERVQLLPQDLNVNSFARERLRETCEGDHHCKMFLGPHRAHGCEVLLPQETREETNLQVIRPFEDTSPSGKSTATVGGAPTPAGNAGIRASHCRHS